MKTADPAVGKDPLLKVRADIEQYGWHCLNVRPRVGVEGTAFSYTIGLTGSYGHPEIIIFGLDDKAHAVLAECATLIQGGARFTAGQVSNDILAGDYEVIFKPLRRDCIDKYLGTALRHYDGRPFDAFVLFWPDQQHQFPWDSSDPGTQAEALHVV